MLSTASNIFYLMETPHIPKFEDVGLIIVDLEKVFPIPDEPPTLHRIGSEEIMCSFHSDRPPFADDVDVPIDAPSCRRPVWVSDQHGVKRPARRSDPCLLGRMGKHIGVSNCSFVGIVARPQEAATCEGYTKKY